MGPRLRHHRRAARDARCAPPAAVVVIAALCSACGAQATPAVAPTRESRAARLVVVAVYDQLGSASLEAQLPHLDPAGAIRRIAATGRYVHRAQYAYATTFTAPGHAAIHTGASPRDSGIGTNRVHSPSARGRVSVLDDGEHRIHGRTAAHASPRALRAQTVADMIQTARPGSIVVSLAMKARSSVLPGGQGPDLCLWFDAAAGGFTTSTWYLEDLPAWLVAWREANPFGAAMETPWVPDDPAALEARLGPDERTGEAAYGFDPSFPHDASGLDDEDAYLSLPASTEHLLALAEEVVARLEMGQDDAPDLLALSIAGTDYVGHAFGPDSWEYADQLLRVDRALGAMLSRLERRIGPIAVLITSDHGAAPLVERAHERGHDGAARVDSDAELALLRAHLATHFGERAIAGGWAQPYVYLTPEVRQSADRDRAVEVIRAWIAARPGVAAALDARAIAGAPLPPEQTIEGLIARSVPSPPHGDVLVIPAEHSVAVEELPGDRGTSHGSPWSYDREVPVLFAGPGITPGEVTEPAQQCAVAGTIAWLADVPAPEHACGRLE